MKYKLRIFYLRKMNTFFFGYLSLKWRRLIRLLIVIYPIFHILFNNISVLEFFGDDCGKCFFSGLLPGYFYLLLIPLSSWLVKPFIVKEKS